MEGNVHLLSEKNGVSSELSERDELNDVSLKEMRGGRWRNKLMKKRVNDKNKKNDDDHHHHQ